MYTNIVVEELSNHKQLFQKWRWCSYEEFYKLLDPLTDLSYEEMIESKIVDIIHKRIEFYRKLLEVMDLVNYINERTQDLREPMLKNSKIDLFIDECKKKRNLVFTIKRLLSDYLDSINPPWEEDYTAEELLIWKKFEEKDK